MTCSKATQDEGRLQFVQVSPTLLCDLHSPKRNELRDVFKSVTCNLHCHAKSASALAQGKPDAGKLAAGTAGGRAGLRGLGWHFPWHSYFTAFRHTGARALQAWCLLLTVT